MARPSAAKNARHMNALKTTLQAYWMLLTSYKAAQQNKLKAYARRLAGTVGHTFNMDVAAESAVEGLIEFVVGFVLLIICVLIALILLPLVNNQANTLNSATNTTATQKSVLPLIGLVLIVAIIVACLAFMVHGFRNVVRAIKA